MAVEAQGHAIGPVKDTWGLTIYRRAVAAYDAWVPLDTLRGAFDEADTFYRVKVTDTHRSLWRYATGPALATRLASAEL